jgi:hypothetical protein
LLGRIQQLDSNEPAGLVVIEDHARVRLIAFRDLAIAKDDRAEANGDILHSWRLPGATSQQASRHIC